MEPARKNHTARRGFTRPEGQVSQPQRVTGGRQYEDHAAGSLSGEHSTIAAARVISIRSPVVSERRGAADGRHIVGTGHRFDRQSGGG